MNAKEIGEIGVLAVAKKLAEKHIKVAFPLGDSARYDLILELSGRFARIQVKSIESNDGMFAVKLYNKSTRNGEVIAKRYLPGQIEALIAYNRSNDSIYILPPKMLKQGQIFLRLEPTTNNQKKGIHWAKDYENALRNIKWKN